MQTDRRDRLTPDDQRQAEGRTHAHLLERIAYRLWQIPHPRNADIAAAAQGRDQRENVPGEGRQRRNPWPCPTLRHGRVRTARGKPEHADPVDFEQLADSLQGAATPPPTLIPPSPPTPSPHPR